MKFVIKIILNAQYSVLAIYLFHNHDDMYMVHSTVHTIQISFYMSSSTSCSSSSSSTQFSQEWARRKVVVKHSIKSNQIHTQSEYTQSYCFPELSIKSSLWINTFISKNIKCYVTDKAFAYIYAHQYVCTTQLLFCKIIYSNLWHNEFYYNCYDMIMLFNRFVITIILNAQCSVLVIYIYIIMVTGTWSSEWELLLLTNCKGITQLLVEILHFKGLGDTENHNEPSLGVFI